MKFQHEVPIPLETILTLPNKQEQKCTSLAPTANSKAGKNKRQYHGKNSSDLPSKQNRGATPTQCPQLHRKHIVLWNGEQGAYLSCSEILTLF